MTPITIYYKTTKRKKSPYMIQKSPSEVIYVLMLVERTDAGP